MVFKAKTNPNQLQTLEGRRAEYLDSIKRAQPESKVGPMQHILADYYANMVINNNQQPEAALYWARCFLKQATQEAKSPTLMAAFNLNASEMIALTKTIWEIDANAMKYKTYDGEPLKKRVDGFVIKCKFDGTNRIRWLLLTVQGGYKEYDSFDKGNAFKLSIDVARKQFDAVLGKEGAEALFVKIAETDVTGMQVK